MPRRTLAAVLLCAAAITGCATRDHDIYFASSPGPEPPAVVVQPPEVMIVPEVAAPMLGQDVLDTPAAAPTNVPSAVVPPTAPPRATIPAPVAPATGQVAYAAAVPAAPRPAVRWATGWIPLQRFATESGLGKIERTIIGKETRYSVPTRNGTFVFTVGSKLARLNDVHLWLGFPAQVIRGEPCLHALDVEKTLQPIASPPVISASTRVIAIDPGHGGADSGTRGPRGQREKDYTLDWALRIESLLTNAGWQVVLTRRGDTDLPLLERVAIAERAKADLFISLHFNSVAPSAGPSGIETYCLTPAGMTSTLVRGFADDIRLSHPNNVFDRANLQLAFKIHRELLTETRALDHGIRRARFMGVLRTQNRPAVLVEGGYLSNPAEMAQIASSAYRQRLAEAVARALK